MLKTEFWMSDEEKEIILRALGVMLLHPMVNAGDMGKIKRLIAKIKHLEYPREQMGG